MKNYIIFFATLLILHLSAFTQTPTTWNGKRCAVVLTYDDGLDIDLSNVVPALDSAGLKGTFYISDYSNSLHAQIDGWRKAARSGHELANHTIWHPCEGGLPGREFVKDYDLRTYTVKRIADEARAMNNLLHAIDGKQKRTFAYPCGDTKLHDSLYIDPLRNDFVAARGGQPGLVTLDKIDLYDLPCHVADNETGEQLIKQVKEAESKNALLIFTFHGVGGGHGINVSLQAHKELLAYLKKNQKNIWTPTMVQLAEFVKSR